MKIYRQGDVLLREVEDIPTDQKHETQILAYGGHSGHIHEMEKEKSQVFVTPDGGLYVDVMQTAKLQHIHETTRSKADHNTITVPPGMYQVVIQQEYDAFAKVVRQVYD